MGRKRAKIGGNVWSAANAVSCVRSADDVKRCESCAELTQIKTGVLSPLQEDEDALLRDGSNREDQRPLKVATVAWLKEPLESWLARAENQMPSTMAATER